jgi:hypothetical protein
MAKEHQDLGGQHIGFEYCDDGTPGSTLLRVYQVKEAKLNSVWDPYEHEPPDRVGDHLNERALRFLKKSNVQRVYTPGTGSVWDGTRPLESFLNHQLSWHQDENNWGIYKPLDKHYFTGFLAEYGIELCYLGNLYIPRYR